MPDRTERRNHLAALAQKLHDTSGAAIALVAITMVALLSAVALAVDIGMMVTARTEAQVVADGAALEGARFLMLSQGDSAGAHAAAMAAGSVDNTVRGENIPVLEEDVDVIPSEWTVRVRAKRVDARGNAVPTFFARIFGVDDVDIVAEGAAWSVESNTTGEDETSCPALPLTLYDKFIESNGEPGWQSPEEVVGWGPDDFGNVLRLKTQPSASGDSEPAPVVNEIDYCSQTDSSWRCWWRMEDEEPNTGNVGEKIRGESCTDEVSTTDSIYNASGNMQSNVHDDFSWLVEQDPDLEWCDTCGDDQTGCVVESPSNECFAGTSLRLRTVPVVEPNTVAGDGGANTYGEVTGFVGVFVEVVAANFADGLAGNDGPPGQRNVYLRIVNQGGAGTDGSGPGDPNATVRTLQLIE